MILVGWFVRFWLSWHSTNIALLKRFLVVSDLSVKMPLNNILMNSWFSMLDPSKSWLCNTITIIVTIECSIISRSSDSNSLAFNSSWIKSNNTPKNFSTFSIILSPKRLSFNFYTNNLNSSGSSPTLISVSTWSKALFSWMALDALYKFVTLDAQAAIK